MGNHITLTAADGFKLGAYRADPTGTPKGGLVVIQEIFGVNHHIRAVCDRFAALGYVVGRTGDLRPLSAEFRERLHAGRNRSRARVHRQGRHGQDARRHAGGNQLACKSVGKVGIVGYCLGGSIAFLAACRLKGLACAIGYYGGMIAKNADEKPKVPTMLHFGETDHSIPMTRRRDRQAEAPRRGSVRLSGGTRLFAATNAAAITSRATSRRSSARSACSRSAWANFVIPRRAKREPGIQHN